MSKYQYSLVDVKYVKENPEEYIIPDCLDACKMLWEKGIDTTQCANYDDVNYRWIEIDPICLSDENKEFIYDMINTGVEGFSIGGMTHNPIIYVHAEGAIASEKLCQLVEQLQSQDTKRFSTSEEYLDNYKRTNGEYKFLPTGVGYRDYNPQLVNATLVDALTANDDWELYIEQEARVYFDKEALVHHLNYLNNIEKKGIK